MPLLSCCQRLLRGFSQIMLQNHSVTGLLFMAAIALGSAPMLLGGLAACALATALGACLRQPVALDQGLYGFNGALVGMAGVVFFQLTPGAIALIAAGSAGATLLTHLTRRTDLPGLTAPFVLTTWLMLLVAPISGITFLGTASADPLPPVDNGWLLASVFRGIGQVMFQDNWVAGALFLTGLFVSNWRHALLALFGSVAGTLALALPDVSAQLVAQGLYSLSPALTAIALGFDRTGSGLLRLFAGVALALTLSHLFITLALPALTAPFVLAVWIVLGLQRILRKPLLAR